MHSILFTLNIYIYIYIYFTVYAYKLVRCKLISYIRLSKHCTCIFLVLVQESRLVVQQAC